MHWEVWTKTHKGKGDKCNTQPKKKNVARQNFGHKKHKTSVT